MSELQASLMGDFAVLLILFSCFLILIFFVK